MIEQHQVDALLAMPKQLVDRSDIMFPVPGEFIQREAKSLDGREVFIFDVNRKGRIKLSTCTYMERYAVSEVLLRLDVDGPPHTNPDGEVLPCPHLHIYREGFETKWACTLPADFTDVADLVVTLREFLKYSGIQKVPSIQREIS